MSLQIFDVEQGTDAWLEARRGVLTASQVGKLLTPTLKVADNDTSRGLTATLAAERISGRVEYVHPNAAMQRGTLDEPYARALYAEQYEPVEEIGFAIRTIDGLKLGASPDGLVAAQGGIEIKSRDGKAQLKTILTNEVPAENMGQVQASMVVMDRPWWDYVSYAGGWPLHVIRVYRDFRWESVILEALETFEANVAQMIDNYNQAKDGSPVAPYIDHFEDMVI